MYMYMYVYVCIHIYIYIYNTYIRIPLLLNHILIACHSSGDHGRLRHAPGHARAGAEHAARSLTADLRTKILDFRGFYSSRIVILRGNSHVHMELPGKLESTNLSRDNLSREIWRNPGPSREASLQVAVMGSD